MHVAFTWGNALGWENYRNQGHAELVSPYKGRAILSVMPSSSEGEFPGAIFYCNSKVLADNQEIIGKVRAQAPQKSSK
jgi:hypothetical protein